MPGAPLPSLTVSVLDRTLVSKYRIVVLYIETLEGGFMAITGLGHTGLWVYDLPAMRDFYERVMGLTVTDEDAELGIVFFSARPDEEHHEFVLQTGRTAAIGDRLQHQVSWRVASLDDIR